MSPKNRTNRNELSSGFNNEDRQQLTGINITIKKLVEEVEYLKEEVEESKLKYEEIKTENEKLKQIVNTTFFKVDELEQYGRRENIRILGVAERNDERDDGEEVVTNVAKALNVELNPELDIQRVHRLGKKKKGPKAKPRPVIVRFASYKKRMEFMYQKSKLKVHPNFNGVYLTEDLTSLRAKMLKYVKGAGKNKFFLFHTINGKIRMKQSAREAGTITNNENDTGTGNWLTIDLPDDLFKYRMNIDFDKLNYTPLKFNIECSAKSDFK